MQQLNKQQVNSILDNAPKGADRTAILDGLVDRGYSLEGVDTAQARNNILERRRQAPVENNPFDREIGEEGGVSGFFKKGVNLIFGGGKLAQGAGQALAGKEPIENMSSALQTGQDIEMKLVKAISKAKQAGMDTTRLEKALFDQQKANIDTGKMIEAYTGSLKTNKEVLGSATRLAGSAVSGSLVGGLGKVGTGTAGILGTTKGMTFGGGIAGRLGGAGVGVWQGLKQGAKIGATSGAIEGAIQGAGFGLEANKDAGGVAKSALGGSLVGGIGGGIVGGAIGAGTGAMKARQEGKQVIQNLLESSPDDSRVAQYKMKGDKIVKDKVGQEAVKQGFDEGAVSVMKGSSAKDKQAILGMADDLEKGMTDRKFAIKNHPSGRLGKTGLSRLQTVEQLNKEAGKQLDIVAKGLKGQPVDIEDAIMTFSDDLDELGVTFRNGKPVFSGSDIEGIAPAESLVKRVVKRASGVNMNDASEVHKLKRFIYTQLDNAKFEGVKGNTERIMSGLAKNLDGQLDNTFPAYNQVNTQFSTTRQATDKLYDVLGSKFDPTAPSADKTLANFLRRLDSNTVSSGRLTDALAELDEVAKSYGRTFDDDIITQAIALQEIESVFPSAIKRNSFQGQITQGVEKAKGFAGALKRSQGLGDLALEAGGTAIEKAQGVNEESALRAFRALLTEGAEEVAETGATSFKGGAVPQSLAVVAGQRGFNYDKITNGVKAKLAQAVDSKPYLDTEATKIAQSIPDTTVAKAPIKQEARSIEKIIKESETGDVEELRDLARNTIVPLKTESYLKVIEQMDARPDIFKKKIQTPDKYMGYEGIIYNIETPNGLIGETQVVMPKMIYGKTPEKDARKILGDALFEQIRRETGLEAGKGHDIYEQFRELPMAEQLGEPGQALIAESVDFYSNLR